MSGSQINTDDVNILRNDVRQLIKKELEIEAEVKEVHRIGEGSLLIKLEKQQDKDNILKSKYKLSKIASGKKYVNEDMTKGVARKGKKN